VERLQITDFGLARAVDDASVTRTGLIAGTPLYMSPEQARGEPIDSRSDLFSLGSVLYVLCTGQPPFSAETSYGILRRITDAEPRPIRELNPEVPEWLIAIVMKLLAKDAGARFPSALQVSVLFESCLAHVQQPRVVPLPREAEELATRAMHAGSLSQRDWFSRRVVRACGVAVLSLASLAVATTIFIRVPLRGPDKTVEQEPVPLAATSEGVPLPQIESESHWDETERQVRELVRDGGQFEQRARRNWETPSISLPTESLPSPSHLSDQERLP